MTLDPRTQLAQTMLMGFTNQSESKTRKKPDFSNKGDRSREIRDRQSMEALTRALLDPFTTVQEARLDSLLPRTIIDSPSSDKKDRASG